MHKQNRISSYSEVIHHKFEQIVAALMDNNSLHSSVRIAFKAVGELLQAHRESIQFMEKTLPLKATKQQMHQQLAQKASIVDLSTSLGSFNDMIDRKVNIADFNTMLQESTLNTDFQRRVGKLSAKTHNQFELVNCTIKDLVENLQRIQIEEQRSKGRLEEAVRILSSTGGAMNERIERISQQLEGIQKIRQDIEQGSLQITKLRDDVKKQIEQTSQQITTLATSSSSKNINSELKETIIEQINNIKQTCEQNEKEIKKFNKGLRKKQFDGIQEVVLKSIEKLRKEFDNIVQEKSTKGSLDDAQIQKAIIKVLKQYSLVTRQEFTKEIMQLQLNMSSKPSLHEVKLAFKAFQQDVLFNIDSIKGELNKRMDTEAITRSRQPIDMQQRPSFKSRELNKFLTVDQFKKYQQDQNIVQQNVCYENIVGRWSWKGAPSSDHIVSWQVEMINTLPDNYIWVAGSHYIKIKNAGLYYIVMGVFSDCREIQAAIYINETQLSQLPNDSEQPNEMVARAINQYVYLRENSRISVYYQDSRNTQGFISIKRL